MQITYDVSCFKRELTIVFPDNCEEYIKEIEDILDEAYNEWLSPEDIENPEERGYVEDSCCEEHMMHRLSSVFNQWIKWVSEYYGNDPEEMEDNSVYWTTNNK